MLAMLSKLFSISVEQLMGIIKPASIPKRGCHPRRCAPPSDSKVYPRRNHASSSGLSTCWRTAGREIKASARSLHRSAVATQMRTESGESSEREVTDLVQLWAAMDMDPFELLMRVAQSQSVQD